MERELELIDAVCMTKLTLLSPYRRVCGTRIRVEMSSGRSRGGRMGGGGPGRGGRDRDGGRGGGRYRFERIFNLPKLKVFI